jgi:hypothetical protein
MKKITFLTLALLVLVNLTTRADWKKVVTNKSEFVSAWSSLEKVNGTSDTIVVDGDNTLSINLGNISMPPRGRVVVTSTSKDIDNLPQLQCGINEDSTMVVTDVLSFFFDHVSIQYRSGALATSGQVFYVKGKYAPIDSFVIRDCEITNIPRTLYRSVPPQDADKNYIDGGALNYLEMSGCKVHYNNITSGNVWSLFVIGQSPAEIVLKNNMFFDMPYSKSILQMSYAQPTGQDTYFTFKNNTVLLAHGSDENAKTNNFKVFDFGAFLGAAATYTISNNMFLTPQSGKKVIAKYDTTTIIRAQYGIVNAKNNIVNYNSTWQSGNVKDENGEYTWVMADTIPNYSPDEAKFAWTDFNDPLASNYAVLKTNAYYTMGIDGAPIGAPMMYVDKFPVKAAVKIAIKGSNSASYTISPVKDQYYIDDVITVTLNTHNSIYHKFNEFKGWSDGNMDTVRVINVDKDIDLTANFEEPIKYLSAFDLKKVTGKAMSSYSADMYYNNDKSYQAKITPCCWSTWISAYTDTIGFETRAAKFGEDALEKQMGIVSRRTPAAVKDTYANSIIITFSTKSMKGINVSAFTGTDNNGHKIQKLEYSTDSTTWTPFAQTELVNHTTWYQLKGDLPASLDNLDKVYVRVISDPTSGHIINPTGCTEDTYSTIDAFEYTGNILITYSEVDGITDVNNDAKVVNNAYYNLMGMKVANPDKGVYIHNGKKVIIK